MRTHKSLASKYLFISAVLICFLVVLSSFKSPDEAVHNPTTHTVTIFKMKFTPADITVNKGDTVIWINKDFYQHDVTEMTNHKWTSKPLNQGEKWSKVINEDINYFCDLHKVMKGTITIAK